MRTKCIISPQILPIHDKYGNMLFLDFWIRNHAILPQILPIHNNRYYTKCSICYLDGGIWGEIYNRHCVVFLLYGWIDMALENETWEKMIFMTSWVNKILRVSCQKGPNCHA